MKDYSHVKVKVCGITSLNDAQLAAAAGATHLGFVFCESPREITPEQAAPIAWALGESLACVGVFKDVPPERILECAALCPLSAIQLHGDYSLEQMRELKSRLGLSLIRAVVPFEPLWSSELAQCSDDCVDMLLLDPRGVVFDWRLCAEAAKLGKPFFLAGCLNPFNVRLAVGMGRPDGVDVATGVEYAPGLKDAQLLQSFCSALTAAPGELEQARLFAGRFGQYGGAYVPETLLPALEELAAEFAAALEDEAFNAELSRLLRDFAGRPTALYEARRLSDELGLRLLLKREDLLHTGAHKINNCLGQALLAKRMGKSRVIAETGAGQHGVATATVCALLGLECCVYMGSADMLRQAPNVERMRLLGSEVREVSSGSATLKDATSEAIRDWVASSASTHYIIGSVVGPHPYPLMVRSFQSIIGTEARGEFIARCGELPAAVLASVGGGSNALGIFSAFLEDFDVELYGAEAGGRGLGNGQHSAALGLGSPGVLHGSYSYLLQDGDGQVLPAHSVSAGLDYPGVGPEHSFLRDVGRVSYLPVTDMEALEAFGHCARSEGIIPALESAHALALARRLAPRFAGRSLLLCLSGCGDKDLAHVLREAPREAFAEVQQ